MRHVYLFLIFACLASSSRGQCNVDGVYFDALLADPNSGTTNFDTDGDGTAEDEDEFVRICNGSTSTVDLSGWTIRDDDGNNFTLSGSLGPGECLTIVTNYMGTPPSGFFDLDLGTPWLNNGGDEVTLSNGSSDCTIEYVDHNDPTTGDQWAMTDGCLSVGGVVDCSLTPSDLDPQQSLPVQFTDIQARPRSDKSVEISWGTAQEVNNNYFEVEHSIDGLGFTVIGQVEGAGSSNQTIQYSFNHFQPNAGINYYRIAQVDYDGTTSYSNTVSVQVQSDLTVELRPTLVEHTLGYDVGEQPVKLILMSLDGSVYQDYKVEGQGYIDCSHLTPGIYTVTVVTGVESVTQRITKI